MLHIYRSDYIPTGIRTVHVEERKGRMLNLYEIKVWDLVLEPK